MATRKIQSGDTLSAIAQETGSTVDELVSLNPQITNPDLIFAGQDLNIPDAPQEAVDVPQVFDTTDVEGTKELVIPNQPAEDSSTSVVEGVRKAIQETEKLIEPETKLVEQERAQESLLTSRLEQELEGLTKRSERTEELETQAGLPGQQERLADLNVELAQLTAGFDAQLAGLEGQGRGIPVPILRGQDARIRRQKAAEIAGKAAVIQAVQGNIATARQTIKDKVDLEFQDQLQEVQNLQTLLNLNADRFNAAEQKRAEKLQLVLNERERKIEEQKTERENIDNLMLQAVVSGAGDDVITRIRNAESFQEAISNSAEAFRTPQANGNWAQFTGSDGQDYVYDKNTGAIREVTVREDGSVITDTFTDANGTRWNITGWAADPNKANAMQATADRIGKLTNENLEEKVQQFAPGITGEMIKQASAQTGVSWEALLTTIVQEATVGGRMSNVANKNNNFGGLTWSDTTQWQEAPYNGERGTARPAAEGGNYIKFPTKEQGVLAMAELMRQYGVVAETPDERSALVDSVIRNVQSGQITLNQAIDNNPDIADQIQLGVANTPQRLDNALFTTLKNKTQTAISLFNDNNGFVASVGTSGLLTRAQPGRLLGDRQRFVGSVEQLISQETIDSLIQAKEKGATFGALSDSELQILQDTATKIGQWRRKSIFGDKVIGYDITATEFRKELIKLVDAYTNLTNGAILENKLKANPSKIAEYNAIVAQNPGLPNDEIIQLLQL